MVSSWLVRFQRKTNNTTTRMPTCARANEATAFSVTLSASFPWSALCDAAHGFHMCSRETFAVASLLVVMLASLWLTSSSNSLPLHAPAPVTAKATRVTDIFALEHKASRQKRRPARLATKLAMLQEAAPSQQVCAETIYILQANTTVDHCMQGSLDSHFHPTQEYLKIEDYVGHTPLVRLNRLPGHTSNTILVKLEGNNPAGSVKDR